MVTYSKVFGPTDSVAGTKTQVGSDYIVRPGTYSIYKIRVGKGNVTNAKECAGLITITVSGVNGPFEFAYGNGVGGATDSQNISAEEIDCAIPMQGGSTLKVYVTDAEAAKDVTVSIEFQSGGGHMRSYSVGGAGSDTTADTELSVGTVTTVKAGTIRQIRFAGSGVVAAKAGTGKLTLTVPGLEGPFEYSVGAGPGGAATGSMSHADVIDVNIPVGVNISIPVKVTTAEVMLSVTVSLLIA